MTPRRRHWRRAASTVPRCGTGAWDYRGGGFVAAVDGLASIAPAIVVPEAPFDRRLSNGFTDSGRARRAAARAIGFGAAWSAGWLMPMGFEYGATRMMDPARDRPDDFAHLVAGAPFDLTAHIAAANARCAAEADGLRTPDRSQPVAAGRAGRGPAA